MTSFAERVLKVVGKISKGKVLTYNEVAEKAGNPLASRAVGNILNKNYSLAIPCHRVVRSDGRPGGYNRSRAEKIRILKREGVWGLV